MKNVDFDALDTSIQNFEKTIQALDRIEGISQKAENATKTLDSVSGDIEKKSKVLSEKSDALRGELVDLSSELKKSSKDLLSIREDIIRSNGETANKVESLGKDISQSLSDSEKATESKIASSRKTLENEIEKVKFTLDKIAEYKSELEQIKAQNDGNRKLMIICVAVSIASLLASIIGILF